MMLLLVSHLYEITRVTPLRNRHNVLALLQCDGRGPAAKPSLVPLCSPFQGRRRRRRRPPPLEAD